MIVVGDIDGEKRWKLVAWALAIAVGVWAARAFVPLVGGYFLSDDFVPMVLFRQWQEEGRLGAALAAKFWSSLDAGESHFYRPLSYLTFAINDLLSGTDARPWMATEVGIHVLNGVMVGAIAAYAAEEKPDGRTVAAGVMGAALFLFFAPGAEVLAWISGRFDVTATFFTLLACLLFQKARRFGDVWSWLSLLSAEAAFLCKEAAAIVPFAIFFLARLRPDALAETTKMRRWMRATRHALPWLILAALYLVSRYLMFGSFTRVYGGTQPMADLLSEGYLPGVAQTLPAWLEGQFRPAYRYPFLCVLTAVQVAIIAFARPIDRRGREAIFCAAALLVITLLLILPHVGKMREDGLGGRLIYQSAVFYAVLAAVALRHARLAYLLWGVTLAVVLLQAAFQYHALTRWNAAYAEMRALVAEIGRLDASAKPGDYTLVIVPGALDDIPFGGNAQGGLMLPPLFPKGMATRLLVQTSNEIPLIAGKVATGVVSTLKERSVFEYLAGKRITTTPPEYPTAVVCFASDRHRLIPLALPAGPAPEAWGAALQRAYDASPCVTNAPRTR